MDKRLVREYAIDALKGIGLTALFILLLSGFATIEQWGEEPDTFQFQCD